ncbi:YjgB family protein [Paenibacillus sp. YIM B09110]|uniref:YjgB family protein n=1 Tax=Paenibacillus sp. YIM B09110 TaxID=3126102 RepID=UPI00301D1BE8
MNPSKNFKKFAVGITFSVALALSACSNANNGENGEQPDPIVSEAPSEAEQTSPSQDVDPSAEPSETPNGTGEQNGGSHTPSDDEEAAVTIGSLVQLAKKGKVPNCQYAAHTDLFDDIEKKWGKPDSNNAAGKGLYAEYKDKGITFGYNKGMVVFDVRSYASELRTIALKDIEKALGKADEQTKNGSDDIYAYEVNKQYQLKFVVSEKTGKVDHISVFSPQDAKNNMAG